MGYLVNPYAAYANGAMVSKDILSLPFLYLFVFHLLLNIRLEL